MPVEIGSWSWDNELIKWMHLEISSWTWDNEPSIMNEILNVETSYVRWGTSLEWAIDFGNLSRDKEIKTLWGNLFHNHMDNGTKDSRLIFTCEFVSPILSHCKMYVW